MQLAEELHFDQPNSNPAVGVELSLIGVFLLQWRHFLFVF